MGKTCFILRKTLGQVTHCQSLQDRDLGCADPWARILFSMQTQHREVEVLTMGDLGIPKADTLLFSPESPVGCDRFLPISLSLSFETGSLHVAHAGPELEIGLPQPP